MLHTKVIDFPFYFLSYFALIKFLSDFRVPLLGYHTEYLYETL